jgi:hypothetical protein
MSSSIVFLSDCTPVYTTLGAPKQISSVSAYPLHRSVRLEWQLPPNSNEVLIDAYIVRYGKYGAPGNLITGYITVFLPTVIVPNLENGVLYSFWVSAKNRFGESPLSPTVSSYAGMAPSPIQIVRRSYHASTQNVGIEFTSPINNNGNTPTTFTIKYRLMNGGDNYDPRDISFTQVESVQPYEQIKDASNNSPLNTDGVKGNFIRKEVIIPGGGVVVPGRYRFTVMSSNIYGTSVASNTYFDVDLPAMTGIFSVRAPSFAYRPPVPPAPSSGLPNGDIYSITPLDGAFRLKWYKYIDIVNYPPPSAAQPDRSGWVYRIQYTDNKDYWYYPAASSSGAGAGAGVACYPEYTVPYNATTDASGIYTFDISMCVVNGRRFYVRYCVVDASGDASEYTQITDTNLDKTSVIPGKAPNPPPIFYASVDDRIIRLYFNWTQTLNSNTYPPSLNLTGGYPILDYRIDRFKITRNDGIYMEEFDVTFNNLIGPFYEDTYDIRVNGDEYLYRIYTRTSFGYSVDYTSVTAIPSRKSDIVHDIAAAVGNNQITLSWLDPYDIDPGMPISQYYIEYRVYNIFSLYDASFVQTIPSDNIVGTLTNSPDIGNNIQDMNAILVDDALWSKLSTTIVKIYTLSLNRSYTITNLINNTPYVFRVAAVTTDRVRRKLVGLMQVIDDASPYLSHPTIIGEVPARLTSVVFTNFSQQVKIEWNSADINNSQDIIRFHIDYRVAGSNVGVPFLRQSFEYLNSLLYKDTTTAYFSAVITGLDNNVLTRPATNSDSYEIFIFAENFVGFTNTADKVRLHELSVPLTTPYENIVVERYVRPMNVPNTVNENR